MTNFSTTGISPLNAYNNIYNYIYGVAAKNHLIKILSSLIADSPI